MANFYFNGAVDSSWEEQGNWWTDINCTVQATSLPSTGDSVFIGGNAAAISISCPASPITLGTYATSVSAMGGSASVGCDITGVTATFVFGDDQYSPVSNVTGFGIGNATARNTSINSCRLTGNLSFLYGSAFDYTASLVEGTITGSFDVYSEPPLNLVGGVTLNVRSGNSWVPYTGYVSWYDYYYYNGTSELSGTNTGYAYGDTSGKLYFDTALVNGFDDGTYEFHYWVDGEDTGLYNDADNGASGGRTYAGYDIDGYDVSGFNVNGDAWPCLDDNLCYVGFALAEGLYAPAPGAQGMDIGVGTPMWFVQGYEADLNADTSPALDTTGTGTWDGCSYGVGIVDETLAGTYVSGVKQTQDYGTVPTTSYVLVTGSSDPLANGYYVIGDPTTMDLGGTFYAVNVNGYYITHWPDEVWEFSDPTAGVFSFTSPDASLIPDDVASWDDIISGGSGPVPTFQTVILSGSTDILLAGFPGSITIFGAGLLAA